MEVPDGTVWTGRYPVTPGSAPRAVVVRVRNQGWTSVDFDIEHSYGGPVGMGRGSAADGALRAPLRSHFLSAGAMMRRRCRPISRWCCGTSPASSPGSVR